MNLLNIKTLFTSITACITCIACNPKSGPVTENPEFLNTEFSHPGMFQSKADLDTMCQNIIRKTEPWASAFEQLVANTDTTKSVKAYTYVSVGAYNTNSIGGKEFSEDAQTAYTCALLWYITRDPNYAKHAIRILNAWSYKLWSLDGNNAKLNIGLFGQKFLNAAEILKHTGADWAINDIKQFEKLLRTVFYPTIQDFFTEANGNWDASMMATMMCMGVFLEDQDIFNKALERFYRGEGNSGITRYIYPTGQCQEATRDWGHVQLGLGELSKVAQIAWTQGIDLYAVADHRLARGYEYTAQFLMGKEMPAFGDISYRDRHISDIYQSIYNHYLKIKGIELSQTKSLIESSPQSIKPFNVLASTRGYDNRYKTDKPATIFDSLPYTVHILPGQTGAMLNGTANIPQTNIVEIFPGENIQSAIDKAEGRWIVLKEGVHKIKQSLRLNNGTKICGEGLKSILMLEPDSIGPTIINATTDLHDVVLWNFVVEGATKPETGFDPNYERSLRLCSHAPSREGIILLSDSAHKMSDIVFRNLTVRNCTKNGSLISGARNITIDRCDFDNNGSNVVPGPYFHHNLHLAHTAQAEITDSRFDSSLWGNGICISFGSDIRILQNEIARNALSGIYCCESRNIDIMHNWIEGNNVGGIYIEQLMEICSNICIDQNKIQYNKEKGIVSIGNNHITLKENSNIGN